MRQFTTCATDSVKMRNFAISVAIVISSVACSATTNTSTSSPFGWITFPTKPTSAPPPAATTRTNFENAVLNLVNSIRYSFQVEPLTWNNTLATEALKCSNQHVSAASLTPLCNCGGGAAETNGINQNAAPSTGARTIISALSWDTAAGSTSTQDIYWYASFIDNDPLNDNATVNPCITWPPTYNEACSHFTQMIWAGTTEFGCGYSNNTGTILGFSDVYVLSCCWSPPGNVPAIFADNIFEDTV